MLQALAIELQAGGEQTEALLVQFDNLNLPP